MKELIAKRYIKALKSGSMKSFEETASFFSSLAESFKDDKFIKIIDNPSISEKDKAEILLAAASSAKSNKINNLIKLLAEHKRINIIPAIALGMKKELANSRKTYQGFIYSDNAIDKKLISELSVGLSKKLDATISLTFIKNDFDGIKVNVEDLGVEINFSKARINSQLIEHIVKAI